MADVLKPWSLLDAAIVATRIEAVAPKYGFHVGLTGGTLYKGGNRKDADFVFYGIRNTLWDFEALLSALCAEAGVRLVNDFGFVVKVEIEGKPADFLFPERANNAYPEHSDLPSFNP